MRREDRLRRPGLGGRSRYALTGRRAILAVLALTAIMIMIAWRLHWPSAVGTIAGISAAGLALAAIMPLLQHSGDTAGSAGPADLAKLADRLAEALCRQWTDEAEIRHVYNPYPLPVSWTAATADLMDSWDLVERAARGRLAPPGGWAASPDELTGTGDDLASVLALVPSGRLVVLGEPGAGKTILMLRLVLDIIKARKDGAPVPVLIPLASWDPHEDDLRPWLANQLALVLPDLASRAPGRDVTCAQALVQGGLVMPILDGLDEVPRPVRGPAVTRINELLLSGPLVVTCRAEEYRDVVRPLGEVGSTFFAAAVIELKPLPAAEVANYLMKDVRDARVRARWDPVTSVLVLNDPSPVARALTTPLMAALAREIYNPRAGDQLAELRNPRELLDHSLENRAAVEELLLDGLIPAAYRRGKGSRGNWTAEQAAPWLSYLAHHLEVTTGGPSLAWWQLGEKPPERLPGPVPCPAWMPEWIKSHWPIPQQPVAAVVFPSHKVRFSVRRALKFTLLGAAAGGLFLITGLLFARPEGLGSVRLTGGLVAVIMLGCTGLALAASGFIAWEGVRGDLATAASPRSVLLRDRRAALRLVLIGAAWALIFTPVLMLVFTGFLVGIRSAIVSSLEVAPLLGAVAGAMLSFYQTAWPGYMLARLRLAMRRRLPWALMEFLEDAHKKGVLRQAGAVYQFRHINLQRHLAAEWKPPRRWWHLRCQAQLLAGHVAAWASERWHRPT